jgi:hypothetical protein
MSRITNPSSTEAVANRGFGFGHVIVGAAFEQCLHQNTRCWNAPRQQLSRTDQMVDGGAHDRYGVTAISTPSPRTRRVDLKQR